MHCVLCKELLPQDGNCVECKGCSAVLHYDCAKISENSYRSLSRERKKNWRCASCRANKEDPMGPRADVNCKNGDANMVMLLELKQVIERLEGKVDKCLKSQQFLSDKYDHFNDNLTKLFMSVDELNKRTSCLEVIQKEHTQVIRKQEERIQALEFLSKRDEIFISGLPKMDMAGLSKTVLCICTKVGVAVDESDINNIQQFKNNNDKDNTNVVVKFNDSKKRDLVLKYKRSVRISKATILNKNMSGEIYLSENLSPGLAKLRREAIEVAKRYAWKYVWVRDGRIFARRDDGERYIRIVNVNDLSSIK